jgi:hypothetical protein
MFFCVMKLIFYALIKYELKKIGRVVYEFVWSMSVDLYYLIICAANPDGDARVQSFMRSAQSYVERFYSIPRFCPYM